MLPLSKAPSFMHTVLAPRVVENSSININVCSQAPATPVIPVLLPQPSVRVFAAAQVILETAQASPHGPISVLTLTDCRRESDQFRPIHIIPPPPGPLQPGGRALRKNGPILRKKKPIRQATLAAPVISGLGSFFPANLCKSYELHHQPARVLGGLKCDHYFSKVV
jgi:hypothetical protein